MKSKPGTYALILRSLSCGEAQIGRWGRLTIAPGYYIYLGSAFGPGGLRARVSRHFRSDKSKHWHIDYLREWVEPVAAWYSYEPVKLEHRWALILSEMTGILPVKGFGCSDCRCHAHLFTADTKPSFARFSKAIGGGAKSWPYQPAG